MPFFLPYGAEKGGNMYRLFVKFEFNDEPIIFQETEERHHITIAKLSALMTDSNTGHNIEYFITEEDLEAGVHRCFEYVNGKESDNEDQKRETSKLMY